MSMNRIEKNICHDKSHKSSFLRTLLQQEKAPHLPQITMCSQLVITKHFQHFVKITLLDFHLVAHRQHIINFMQKVVAIPRWAKTRLYVP